MKTIKLLTKGSIVGVLLFSILLTYSSCKSRKNKKTVQSTETVSQQEIKISEEEKLVNLNENWEPKEKMKLHYKINGSDDFVIKIMKLGDAIIYVWYKNGSRGFLVNLTENAMNNSFFQLNYIYGKTGMPPQKHDNATSIFCSRAMFNTLINEGDVTFYPYDSEENPKDFPVQLNKDEKVKFKISDNKENIIEIDAVSATTESGESLIILNNPRFPLILKMELDFEIELVKFEIMP
jgi:hypothetical protein